MTATLKFSPKDQQFMVDVVHFFGRDEVSRHELRKYAMNFGILWAPSFIVKNESCKSATRGMYKLPVKRLQLMTKLQPSQEVLDLVTKRDELMATLPEGSESPITVIEAAAKVKAPKAPKAPKEPKAPKTPTTKKATKKTKATAKKSKKKKDTEVVVDAPEVEDGSETADVPELTVMPTTTAKSKKVSKKQAILDKMEKMRIAQENEVPGAVLSAAENNSTETLEG